MLVLTKHRFARTDAGRWDEMRKALATAAKGVGDAKASVKHGGFKEITD
ncbi:hypothetical protein [Corynebacterium silvaticum]|uniref:Uncharacterized protein n=1 Tax=Corynebacterium silvaticum TaxID=2320431 RepID=A0ACD4PYS3_9CORY|nr:hypothetical protein [Corynebacterium silvaticum]MBH5300128.1 hypothetical protein [Corynebacterium silvaticum]NOM65871.1 hypothetical protein [Corynebacterium silvaticum]NON70506.1 hypothetical protein [Corynebacterium silvaticum]UWH00657.1 hypothetical protein K1I39_02405 [Corynebacterium silvaticum]UWH02704.1 hypothetical protein K1I38_02415 [Corynebacterium silvaticum]